MPNARARVALPSPAAARSLADFAKLVEVFDRTGVSFVSVTQQFNTTTSMGRLTLNILLSFAQYADCKIMQSRTAKATVLQALFWQYTSHYRRSGRDLVTASGVSL
jgi:hypothetical protein